MQIATDNYQASNPRDNAPIGESHSFASTERISSVLQSAADASRQLTRLPREAIADFVETVRDRLTANTDRILEVCELESALPRSGRLDGELVRTCSVLTIFANLIRSGEISDSRISAMKTDTTPPRPDVRRRAVGVGPILVLEASNFPLAFGIAGGDTASAWAAGCPVIAKIHPYHPGTSEVIASIIQEVVRSSAMPEGIFSAIHGGPQQVELLVRDPRISGVAFTGSRAVGKRIREIANTRETPLAELSLEMGSVNPIFILPGALTQRGSKIADELVAASLLGAGQYCTNPGVVIVPSCSEFNEFTNAVRNRFVQSSPMVLLNKNSAEQYEARLEKVSALSGVSVLAQCNEPLPDRGAFVKPTLFTVSAGDFRSHPDLREEIFGPAMLLVKSDEDDYVKLAQLFDGELTGSIHFGSDEHEATWGLVQELERRVGRLIFNGYPPGVPLCDAVNHGGLWPSALGRSTVVGPTSYQRWTRPICYQNAPDEFLPRELTAQNQTKALRRFDGGIQTT